MRPALLLASLLLLAAAPVLAQTAPATATPTAKPASPAAASAPTAQAAPAPQVVEAACGQCRLGLPGHGCELAVRIDGKAYFVDGTGIDQHGDAHAKDGFCSAIRHAEVRGQVVKDRFVVTSFKLLPEPAAK